MANNNQNLVWSVMKQRLQEKVKLNELDRLSGTVRDWI